MYTQRVLLSGESRLKIGTGGRLRRSSAVEEEPEVDKVEEEEGEVEVQSLEVLNWQ